MVFFSGGVSSLGFEAILYSSSDKEPQGSLGNYLGSD